MLKRFFFIVLISALFIGSAVLYYVFVYSVNHHRDINKEQSVTIASGELIQAFEQNEVAANNQYLNKVVTTKGVLIEIGQDQAGKTTLLIGNADALSNVFVTLASQEKLPTIGDSLTIKGICNGYLSDVVISDAIVIN